MDEMLQALKEASNEQKEALKRIEDEQKEALKRIEDEQKELRHAIVPQQGPSQSASSRGADGLKSLLGHITPVVPLTAGSAVLDANTDAVRISALAEFTTEKDIVACLTPIMHTKIFQPKGLTMVSGENYAWPGVPNETARKPDNNVGAPFVLRLMNQSQTQFGDVNMAVPATADICTDVRPIEAKLNIGVPGVKCSGSVGVGSAGGNAGVGELEDYVKTVVAAHTRNNTARKLKNLDKHTLPISIPCMLYDKEYYWLLTAGTYPSFHWSHLTYGKFIDRGSVESIGNHFPLLPWENATFGVFTELSKDNIEFLDPLLNNEVGKTSFLGQGGSGRVFCAINRQLDLKVAVKVVLLDQAANLEHEFNLLSASSSTILPLVKPCSQFVHGNFGAGYAMTPQGIGHVQVEHLSVSTHRATMLHKAFTSLSTLHTNGVVHGDARLANLIYTQNNDVVWADLRRGSKGFLGYCSDMQTLSRSILHIEPHVLLETSLLMTIESYASACDASEDMSEHIQSIISKMEGLAFPNAT